MFHNFCEVHVIFFSFGIGLSLIYPNQILLISSFTQFKIDSIHFILLQMNCVCLRMSNLSKFDAKLKTGIET